MRNLPFDNKKLLAVPTYIVGDLQLLLEKMEGKRKETIYLIDNNRKKFLRFFGISPTITVGLLQQKAVGEIRGIELRECCGFNNQVQDLVYFHDDHICLHSM